MEKTSRSKPHSISYGWHTSDNPLVLSYPAVLMYGLATKAGAPDEFFPAGNTGVHISAENDY